MTEEENKKRWAALIVLCLGALMIVLDTTIVNVALPSIRASLGFNESSLAWVVNAYLLTFGGFLLLGGRLGDLYGHRRVFLWGLALFTIASLACGFAFSQWFLIAARSIQGLGGAVVNAVALSLTMNLFSEPKDRAKAMGVFGFVAAGGGSLGVLLGGLLTTLNWHYIFLVNIPIGIIVFIFSRRLLPREEAVPTKQSLDIAGALAITISLILANYAVVNGNASGWLSITTFGLFFASVLLLIIFVRIEAKAENPLMPLRLFGRRNIVAANIVGVLWAAAMFSWFFISALYMQLILGYTPLQVGLSFLPANLIMACFSLGLSEKIVMRFGIRGPLAFGLSFAAAGLAYLSLAPLAGGFAIHILPSMVLLGIGAGTAFNPVLLAAMSDVDSKESGLASGLVNTSFMMGGALGLAALVSLAAARTAHLLSNGSSTLSALNGGYHAAFLFGALSAFGGALVGILFLRIKTASIAGAGAGT